MEHARKMIMMPAEAVKPLQAKQAPYMVSDANIVKQDKKSPTMSTRTRELKLVWKIAFAKGYDENGRLIDSKGNIVANSDIGSLIGHALSHGRVLVGENEFIQLLKRANVDPELILNDNVKLKLINAAPIPLPSEKPENSEIRVSTQESIEAEPYETITRVAKRGRDEEVNLSDAKKGKWQIKSAEFPKMVIKKLKPKRRWVVPSENESKSEWEIPVSDYPKMTLKRVKENTVTASTKSNNDLDKWRNIDYENSDADSDVEEIIEDAPPEVDSSNIENKSFTLAPSRFPAAAKTS